MSTNFFAAVGEESSPGLAGRIEQILSERPWLTSTEIAKALKKSPDQIASLACKLVREGRLLREWNLSARGGSLFARNAPHLTERNAAVLVERIAENDARMGVKAAGRISKAFAKAGAATGSMDA